MKGQNERIVKLVHRKKKNESSKWITGTKKNEAIDESKLSVREMRSPSDRQALNQIARDYHRDFYINIYKRAFRSWFTYSLTGLLLALSVYFLHSSLIGLCVPPVLMTLYLLWRVNKYKKSTWCLSAHEMELINQTESHLFKFKSTEARRRNQGVLVAVLREPTRKEQIKKKLLGDNDNDDIDEQFDLMDLDEIDDLSSSTSGDEDSKSEQRVIAYLIYKKQKGEADTVSIKDMSVHVDYRRRGVAKNFIRLASLQVFKQYGYSRVVADVSNFHPEARAACMKKAGYVHQVFDWTAFRFVPGVADHRLVFSFNIDQVGKLM